MDGDDELLARLVDALAPEHREPSERDLEMLRAAVSAQSFHPLSADRRRAHKGPHRARRVLVAAAVAAGLFVPIAYLAGRDPGSPSVRAPRLAAATKALNRLDRELRYGDPAAVRVAAGLARRAVANIPGSDRKLAERARSLLQEADAQDANATGKPVGGDSQVSGGAAPDLPDPADGATGETTTPASTTVNP